jgi:mannan endo-1,4-beta-mannosidase
MRRLPKHVVLITAAVATLTAGMVIHVSSANAATGIHVSGQAVLESNGKSFMMRGTNQPHDWYPSQTTSSLKQQKAWGANTVRVVLSGGRYSRSSASDVAGVVSTCKSNKLICILEDHDTTGYGEASGAYSLSSAADFWISIKSAFVGQENYVLINIGNEPYGNNNISNWTGDTKSAISKLRSAGIANALVVDGPNWGQDNNGVMKSNAASVESTDPNHNTIFSIHMYSQYSSASTIKSYISTFKSNNLPLIVGEFGPYDAYGNVDEDTIMATAHSSGYGMLGWSWSGNSSDLSYLDQVNNFNAGSLSTWGNRLWFGTDGIQSTSTQASIYG